LIQILDYQLFADPDAVNNRNFFPRSRVASSGTTSSRTLRADRLKTRSQQWSHSGKSLGGAALPDGELWTFHVPESLQCRYHLAPRYENVCFDRSLSLRKRGSELGGIGHPLVDALLKEVSEPGFTGEVAKNP
jgi:hypothetical protein